MPSIHVSSDATTIGRIVELLLSYGNRVQFHGDNDDNFDVSTEWDQPSDFDASDAGRMLLAEVEQYQRERALERFTARREQWQRDHQEYEFNLGVPCSHCQAPVDAPCLDPRGNDRERPFVHAVRRRLAHQATYSDQPFPPVTLDEMEATPVWDESYSDIDRIG